MKSHPQDAKNSKELNDIFRSPLRSLHPGGGLFSSVLPVFIFLSVLFSAGCAKIAEPQPPEIRIPHPAVDLAARQLSDFVVLTFSKPERNTNGSQPTTLKSVEIFRLAEDTAGALPPDQFVKKALRIQSIPASRFAQYLRDNTFVVQDRFLTDRSAMYSHTFRYAVRFINNKNQNGGPSNQVSIMPIPIPLAPAGLTYEPTESSIRLKWATPSENMDGSKPARVAGYNIYRSEDLDKFPSSPINPDPVQTPEFIDRNVRFDTTYYYAISIVGSMSKPFPESLPSEAIKVDYRDVFPPLPPKDFTAILQGDMVILLWAPSPSSDVTGYRLYRQERGKPDRQLVQPDLIRALSFRDTRVDPEKEYEYGIRAVDTHGNESPEVNTAVERR
jgi:hypothetical protein